MRFITRFARAVVYTLALASANAGFAGIDPALAVGPMEKLVLSEPRPLPDQPVLDMAEGETALPKGQWMVLNFWATWCVPCREEMPALAKLAREMPQVKVVALAVGPNPVAKIEAFMTEVGAEEIEVLRDPGQRFAREAGVLRLPVTVIVDPEGREVARLIGGADWGAPEALDLMRSAMK